MARSIERKNTRMKQWDYSSDGLYFVTICVKHRAHVLGTVRKGKMILNEWGKTAHECWQEIPIHFPGVDIDQFVVMPNHVHGIVVLRDDHVVGDEYIYNSQKMNFNVGDADLRPLQTSQINTDRTKMKLSKIIHGFKSSVTREINKFPSNNYFQWQRSFHDHIIRNERALVNIQNYIFFNPDNWRDDDFFVQSS